MWLDTIKLAFGNNLILGNLPDAIGLDRVSEKDLKDAENRDTQSFGLFDANQANYNTYFPDVTAEDLAPKDGEFIEPVFRALSEVIVHKDFNPVDFGMKNVLKKSMNLLNGATVNADHETAIGNALGAVKAVSWEDSYKEKNGIIIPAGINTKLKLDGKSHPRIARAIMMDPPAIHSTSVTVQFKWDKSHDMTQEDFFSKLGSLHKDGKIVRRIATEVKRYHEISLVSHGADPYAQLIKDTGIVNPKWADISYNSLTGDQKQKQKHYFFDFKTDVVSNSIPKESNNNSSSTTNVMNKEFLIALAAVLGITLQNSEEPGETETKLVQDAVSGLVTAKADIANTLTEKENEITRLQEIEVKYNAESETFKEAVSLKQFKESETNKLRTSVLAAYKTIAGEKAQETISNMITGASYETLAALNIQYTEQLEEKFPISCKKCGGTEINRASAVQKKAEEGSAAGGNIREKLKAKAAKSNKAITTMHDKVEEKEA